ncbi:MAG: hypothetical protein WB995_12865 [Candidatus Acidiferrales bacterium]
MLTGLRIHFPLMAIVDRVGANIAARREVCETKYDARRRFDLQIERELWSGGIGGGTRWREALRDESAAIAALRRKSQR